MQLKVPSWNIWIDGHFDSIKDFLRDADADIIGLQEVKDDDPERDVIGYLTELGYQHVFTPVAKKWKDKVYRDGCAVFSKHEIVSSMVHKLSEKDSRYAQQADVKINGSILHVFSTHLIHTHQKPSEVQELQAETLVGILPTERTIVMGDFNATPDSATIQKMKRDMFYDTDSASMPTWSVYPEGCHICNPQAIDIKLDYIFASKDLKTASFKVEESKGSDHLPIAVLVERGL